MSRRQIWLCFLFCLLLMVPSKSFAHSSLVSANPAPSSTLVILPKEVVLTFNERLEKQLFYIKVIDSNGKSVTKNETHMSEDQKQLQLDLPSLNKGNYTVSYKIISADGHPVGGSYVFTFGQTDQNSTPSKAIILQIGGGLTKNITLSQIFLYSSRFLFYTSLLGLIGWIFWRLLYRPDSEEIRKVDRASALYLQCIFMISLLLMIFAQLQELLNEWQLKNVVSLFFGTMVGYSWLLTLALSLSGFFLLFRSKLLDFIWTMLLLVAKIGNGHAMNFEPKSDIEMLDFIHLFSAAIWIGGLFYILMHWRKDHEAMLMFLPQFSKYALISMIFLILSGSIYTMAILPNLKYILYTQWGILLLVKVFLVVLVVIVGGLLRYSMKKKKVGSIKRFFKMDMCLMIVILMIVGVFTYLNPLPVNTPFYWHEMGSTVHMTTQIIPTTPGKNRFNVEVWMPEMIPKPKSVLLLLTYKDDSSIAPIEVPLIASQYNVDQVVYAGFRPFSYTVDGPYLPFPGKWVLEVNVLDIHDMETKYKNEMMIY